MNTPTRLAAFAAALALVFGAGWGLGALMEPQETSSPSTEEEVGHAEH